MKNHKPFIGRKEMSDTEFEKYYCLGQWVQTTRGWPAKLVQGIVCETYGTGVTIAWNLQHKPLPVGLTAEEIGSMCALDRRCPLRDGWGKEDSDLLVRVPGKIWTDGRNG